MAKYVCDFETVYSVGENICNTSTDLQNKINTYSTNIDSDLSGWDSNAKNAFSSAKNSEIQAATADCTYINEVGEFVKTCSKSIQDLEEQLSSLSI